MTLDPQQAAPQSGAASPSHERQPPRIDALTDRTTRGQRGGLAGFAALRGGRPTRADVTALISAQLARADRFEGEAERVSVRRSSMARKRNRASMRHRGLSNTAYLAASPQDVNFQVVAGSARVKFRLWDRANENSMARPARGARRGVVRELSDGARDRLANRAWSLTAEGFTPQVMLTLTAPANWEALYAVDHDTGEVLEGGRVFKRHMQAFRKRLDRLLLQYGVQHWSALWFLEFQQRGAPHLHLMLFDCLLSRDVIAGLRAWAGRAWSQVVGNPDQREARKHRRAGTRVERMKCGHFGYAVKYATKTEQKTVPDGFQSVGRFWGVWNYQAVPPVVLDFDLDCTNPEHLAFLRAATGAALGTVHGHSPAFVASTAGRLDRLVGSKGLARRFSFSVFGVDAVQGLKNSIT